MARPKDFAQRMLTRAMEQIEERGEQGLRVNDLCAEVGVPITSLYHYYGNRDGLVAAAYAEMYVKQLRDDLLDVKERAQACEDAAAFRAMFEGFLAGFMQPEREALRLRRMQIVGATYRRPGLRAAVGRAQGSFLAATAAALDVAKERGWIRADLDTRAYAAWFEGQMLGQVMVLLEGSEVTREQWLGVAAPAVMAVLFGDVPGVRRG